MGRALSPEPSASADAEALLDGPVFLAVLLRCPDERPSGDRERKHADGGNHYPEKGAHGGSLGSAERKARSPWPVLRPTGATRRGADAGYRFGAHPRGGLFYMRGVFLVAAAVVATVVFAGGAAAITYGVPDGDGHPEVGALLAQQAFSDGTWEECSGTLIAPRVFLTAAHCDEGVSRVAVTFDSSYDGVHRHGLLGHLACRPRLQPVAERPAGSGCRRARQGRQGSHPRPAAGGGVAERNWGRRTSSSPRSATAPRR